MFFSLMCTNGEWWVDCGSESAVGSYYGLNESILGTLEPVIWMAWNSVLFPLWMWKLSVFFIRFVKVLVQSIFYTLMSESVGGGNIQMKSAKQRQKQEKLSSSGFFSFCSIHYRTLLPRSTEAHSASPPSQIKQWGVIETWQKKRESDCRGEVTFARSNAETAATNGEFRVNTHEALRVIPSFIPIFSSWGANYAIMIEQRAKWLCLR